MQQTGPTNKAMPSLRRAHRWRMAASGIVILLAGVTLGVAGTLLFMPTRRLEPPPDVDAAVAGMVRWFRGELSLSEEQVGKIETILRQHMRKLEELRQEARPKIDEQLAAMKQEIGKVLTPEQNQTWQAIVERLDREWHRGFRPRGGGPGRPGEGPRGGRGEWPGVPGPGGGRRGFDANAPRPWGGGFGPGDVNAPRGERLPRFDRFGPNDVGRPQRRDRGDGGDIRPAGLAGRTPDPNAH